MTKNKSLETTHNKRAGIFYGPSDGHPIIWNNDWNNLIQRETAARQVPSSLANARSLAFSHI
jgi:hypothetical protein